MDLTQFPPGETVNLTNCDREPIHTPGLIQPHGILLVLSSTFAIEQVSANTKALLGVPPETLLGQPLVTFLGSGQIEVLQNCLQRTFEQVNPLKLVIQIADCAIPFDGILHRSLQDKIILELEPPITAASDFFNFYQATKGTLTQIQQAMNLSDLCAVMVKEVRRMTGFERVMIYQFDAEGAGMVIAEDKADDLEPFLGLHYPDSDIPQQAKRLYALNLLRLIPDVRYHPVPILTQTDSAHVSANSIASLLQPLDLSWSVLRSVSPMHVEYLNNMRVRASMSISLMKDKRLWGLIACHSRTPRFVPYEIRTVCEFLGQVMSLELASREANENLDYKVHLKSIQSQCVAAIAQADNLTDVLVQQGPHLLELVGAEGAAVYAEGTLTTIGKTPVAADIHSLIRWLENQFEQDLFVTNALPHHYPPAFAFKSVGSGLLALSITKIRQNYLLWFRPEVLQYVNWAGNPNKQQQIQADGSISLSPRRSFALWQETVCGKSLPWQPCEIEGAIELRSAIVGILLRKADELAAINLELERSNVELDAFTYIASHDLKEPLRGIHNYATFLLKDYANILDAEGVSKLEALVRLTRRMEDLINALLHFSRLGQKELKLQVIDLNELLHDVSEILTMSQAETPIKIVTPRPLPQIRGDRILMEEVFTNLISNGLKYNTQSHKQIEVGWLDPDSQTTPSENSSKNDSENSKMLASSFTASSFTASSDSQEQIGASPGVTLYIRDNGIGIRQEHLEVIFRIFKRLHAPGKYGGGTGAGLTIVKKIVERHGGKIWVESTYGEGSTFYLTLPN